MASEGVCFFCGLDDDSELKYGKLIKKHRMTVHYFCMLFSSALRQRGSSTRVGILGFLVSDIEKEKQRGQKLRCIYCKKQGATIGCSIKKCKKIFHYPCGVNNNTMHQFFGSYASFCPEHCLKQEIPSSDRLAFHGTANSVCPICLCSIETRTSHQTLRTPCCKHSWIHRACLQEQAVHFGYFFRCPLCNNKDEFQVEMLTNGIYIPEQDASWELEENAFHDLLYRHNRCDHSKCRCPNGNSANENGSRWEIILCEICGSQGCHIACGRLSFYKPYFECQMCQSILKKTKTKSNKRRRSENVSTRESRPVRRLGRSATDPAYLKEVEEQLAKRILSCQSELRTRAQQELSFIDSKVLDVESSASPASSSSSLFCAVEFCPVKRPWPENCEDGYVEVEADVESSDELNENEHEVSVDDNDCCDEVDVADNWSTCNVLRLSPSDFPSPVASDVDVFEPNLQSNVSLPVDLFSFRIKTNTNLTEHDGGRDVLDCETVVSQTVD